jgi:hypothetical protein
VPPYPIEGGVALGKRPYKRFATPDGDPVQLSTSVLRSIGVDDYIVWYDPSAGWTVSRVLTNDSNARRFETTEFIIAWERVRDFVYRPSAAKTLHEHARTSRQWIEKMKELAESFDDFNRQVSGT